MHARLTEAFWAKVSKNGPIPSHVPHLGQCWVWTPSIAKGGYGYIRFRKRRHVASRLSWEIHHGKIPKRKPIVCNKCDNPPCVNPSHLFIGTHKDNMRDMIAKGRCNRSRTIITYKKETLPITEWATRLGIRTGTLANRLKRYPIGVALTKPKQKQDRERARNHMRSLGLLRQWEAGKKLWKRNRERNRLSQSD